MDRKAVELGLAGARTDYIQTDAAINKVGAGSVQDGGRVCMGLHAAVALKAACVRNESYASQGGQA